MKPNTIYFSVPMSIDVGVRKKKTIYLNMNNIHTMHHQQYNGIKKKMKALIADMDLNDFYFEGWKVHYGIYLPDRLKRDVANVGSIVDKFVCDAIVELGHAPDDNYNYLQHVTYEYMGYDKDKKGYVVVTITEVDDLKDV